MPSLFMPRSHHIRKGCRSDALNHAVDNNFHKIFVNCVFVRKMNWKDVSKLRITCQNLLPYIITSWRICLLTRFAFVPFWRIQPIVFVLPETISSWMISSIFLTLLITTATGGLPMIAKHSTWNPMEHYHLKMVFPRRVDSRSLHYTLRWMLPENSLRCLIFCFIEVLQYSILLLLQMPARIKIEKKRLGILRMSPGIFFWLVWKCSEERSIRDYSHRLNRHII